jgi:hypothetical protein
MSCSPGAHPEEIAGPDGLLSPLFLDSAAVTPPQSPFLSPNTGESAHVSAS